MDTPAFHYVNDELFCEKLKVSELAEEYGTPLFVYSKARLKENLLALLKEAKSSSQTWRVSYALKANSNPELLRLIASLRLGASVVSGGELLAAIRAGFAPETITFDGPGKTDGEIRLALTYDIKAIVVESNQELERIADIAATLDKQARVYIRVNPHVDAKTHPYISTGLLENKFGIDLQHAEQLISGCRYPWVNIVGLHSHIGSQITQLSPFEEAATSIADFVRLLKSKYDISITEVDLGGGLAVPYHDVIQHPRLDPDPSEEEQHISSLKDYFQGTGSPFDGLSVELTTEPGRAIIADTCALISRVLYTKTNSARTFIIIDAAMNDLIRPSLYGSYHQIVPAKMGLDHASEISSVVGPICETGDFMALDRRLPTLRPDEFIAIMCAGAYGFVLSSNYNLRPRAAEVLISNSDEDLIRERQTIEEILQ